MTENKVGVEELLRREFSGFDSVKAKIASRKMDLVEFIQEIRSDEHQKVVSDIRKLAKDEQREKKVNSLPAVSLSGVSPSRSNRVSRVKHSGLLQLDFDLKDNSKTPEEMREILQGDPHIVAVFESPSGGMKAVAAISQSTEDHKDSFEAARVHFKELGLEMDGQPKNHKSLCFLSHDPKAWMADGDLVSFRPIKPLHSYSVTQNLEEGRVVGGGARSSSGISKALNRKKAKRGVEENLKAWKSNGDPDEIRLWEKYVEGRFKPDFAQRNSLVVKFVSFAFHRMSDELVLTLANRAHAVFSPFYNDSSKQHDMEVRAMLNGVQSSFLKSLKGKDEREYYLYLEPDESTTFRICRSLAALNKPKKLPPPLFFLSCRDLGERIGINHMKANHLLRDFVDEGILDLMQKGTRGSHREATTYRWNLTL
jgi:hypothetical protein